MISHEDWEKLYQKVRFYTGFRNEFEYQKVNPIHWGAPYLQAVLLFHAQLSADAYISRSRLDNLAKEFTDKTQRTLDINWLIENGWIRIVMGSVTLSKEIGSAASQAHRFKDLVNEIKFLSSLQGNVEINSLKELTFQEKLKAYQEEHKIELNLAKASTENFLEKTEGKIKIKNASLYLAIAENLSSFLFIETLQKKINEENKLTIKTSILRKLYKSHLQFFKATPNLKEFFNDHTFTKLNKEQTTINFRRNETFAADKIKDQASAILWVKLLDDAQFSDDMGRLKFWYRRSVAQNYSHAAHLLLGDEQKRFLDAALAVVLDETDFTTGKAEYDRIMLDPSHSRLYRLDYFLAIKPDAEMITLPNDPFALWSHVRNWKSSYEEGLFYGQYARQPLNFFITELVNNDHPHLFPYTTKLLEQAPSKPYIFWYTCFIIHQWRPSINVFLAKNHQFASLATSLLYKLKSNVALTLDSEATDEVISECFFLINDQLSKEIGMDQERKGQIIFQILMESTIRKFLIRGPYSSDNQKKEKEQRVNIDAKLRGIFISATLPGMIYDNGYKRQAFFYPELIKSILKEIVNHQQYDPYKNGTFSLALEKLDLFAFLLELPLHDQHPYIASEITKSYLTAMNTKAVTKIDHFTKDNPEIESIPNWRHQGENLTIINWPVVLINLYEQKHLASFLSPKGLVFTKAKSKWDAYNRFVAEKLRSHLTVLLTAYNRLYQENDNTAISTKAKSKVLTQLEATITSYVTHNSINDHSRKRFDIFDDLLERSSYRSKEDELLPIIGTALNRFSKNNKRKIIIELVKTDQILRSLVLLEYIISEADRKALLSAIIGANLPATLSRMNNADAQFIVQHLSKEALFIKEAKAAIDHLESSQKKRRHTVDEEKDQIFLYQSKLLMALQTKDEKELEKIPVPVFSSFAGNEFSASDEKAFFRGIIYLDTKKPKAAFEIYNRLLSRATTDRPSLALNRFAAKLQWAKSIKNRENRNKLLTEALSEWQDFENKIGEPAKWAYMKDKVRYNQLDSYNLLNDTVHYEQLYNELTQDVKLRPDFLQLRIEYLVVQKMIPRAESLLNEARVIHQLDDETQPEFISSLEILIAPLVSINDLQNHYNRIFRSAPDRMIKIIPEAINSATLLPEFIMNEIHKVIAEMLIKINCLSAIDHEDKYSEMIMFGLNAAFIHYQWHTETERGGHPDTGGSNLGEIDFSIKSSNGERIAVCEALILESKNTHTTNQHVLKVFNYHPARNLFFLVTYYRGNPKNFDRSWAGYSNVITNSIKFPDGYEPRSKNVMSVKHPFNDAIRVGKTIHKKDILLYHLFINVNYKLS